MKTITRTKSTTRLNTKQKVIVGVSIGALFFSLGGILSTMGKARGFGFGWPVMKRPIKNSRIYVDTSVQQKSRNAILPTYRKKTTTPIVEAEVEICNNNVDDDSNGKVDCNDLYCYKRDLAPINICSGDNGQGRVLIVGSGYGFVEALKIKSDIKTNKLYESGTEACIVAFGINCAYIEQYLTNKWEKLDTIGCSAPINLQTYNTGGVYRAVCQGLDGDNLTGEITIPGMITNN
ncbi:hypothetical protein HN858_00670 [Candidatus Falkowbacteria bacterium]|jgi:hypothetical protein|nr:hypothetical protein [Candidatus Falkowbacteria bacterium]MBT5503264.1 hypothetical protein [Candidatus Falkowbacteria bacterium]MBT6574263.1 hypothetical protein [Candidatus Falkowbacteria bacterium]MBT7348167.1 hypothetical protein [Candidatus Falkowbacteria bacterium]MBT7500772.1 hypothetical protein [Candidatus Falkowbacteria bacterium]